MYVIQGYGRNDYKPRYAILSEGEIRWTSLMAEATQFDTEALALAVINECQRHGKYRIRKRMSVVSHMPS